LPISISSDAIFVLFQSTIGKDAGLFEFRQTDVSPVLLVLDRRDDAVTPMLNQVNYRTFIKIGEF